LKCGGLKLKLDFQSMEKYKTIKLDSKSNSMKNDRKAKIMLAVLILIAMVISVYSVSTYYVASYVHDYEGTLKWPTPGYTFLPWPKTPTGAVITMVVPVNQTDIQYYRYIIQSGLLVVLTILSWLAVFWSARRLWKLDSSVQIARND
jgi:hypothetical protein